jgi:hypothetical protein
MPMTKKLHSDIIKLLCKLINVNNLLYTYANVMQKSKQFIMFTKHMQQTLCLDLILKIFNIFDTNVNTFTKLHKQKYIFPFPKYELIWYIYPFKKKNNSLSLVEWNNMEPKFVNDSLSIKLII